MIARPPRPLVLLLLGGCFYSPQGTATTATSSTSGPTTSEVDTSTSEGTTTTTTTTTTTGVEPAPTVGGGGTDPGTCDGDDECAAGLFCVAGACGDCLQARDPDAACAERDPAAPVCGDTGQCVQCSPRRAGQCEGYTPYCDPEALACVACDAHEHCPDSACNLASGACLPPENVRWLDDAADCNVATGAEATPFCTITQALMSIEADDQTAGWTLRTRGQFSNFSAPQDAVVAILGVGDEPARFVGSSELSLFAILGGTMFFERVVLTGGYGLWCQGGLVWFDRSVSTANATAGVEANGCITTIRRSVVHGNPIGISASLAGETVIENSYVTGNGQGIVLADGAELAVNFSTVAENHNDLPDEPYSLDCEAPGAAVTLRNSVMMAQGAATVDCPGATATRSVLTAAAIEGSDNLSADFIHLSLWFDPPKEGVYRVRPNAPLDAVARWQGGDPRVDFDGEARPDGDDSPEWPGADRP